MMKVQLGVEVLALMVIVVIFATEPSEGTRQIDPGIWRNTKSCIINITENLGGGRKRERSYCCEGWRSMMTNSGQISSCSSYVGVDNITSDSDGLSTHAEWKKISKEVRDIHDRLFLQSSIDSLDEMQKEIDRYQKVLQYLEGKVEEHENRLKTFGTVLDISIFNPPPTEDPCFTATCIDHPDAVCLTVSKCSRDYPVFMDINTFNLIDDCRTIDGECLPRPPSCNSSLCNGLSCPSLTNATCIVDEECCIALWQTVEGDIVQCPDGGVQKEGRRKRFLQRRNDTVSYC